MKDKRIWWVVGGSAVFLVAILVAALGFLVRSAVYSGRISVMVAPGVARVVIGGEEYGSLGEYEIRPGEYEVEVSAEGFVTKTGKLTVGQGGTMEVMLFLVPEEGNEGWYDQHPGDALIKGEILNGQTLGEVRDILAKAPVLSELPRTVEYFTEGYGDYVKYVITYEYDLETSAGYRVIVKDYTGGNEERAKAWLSERGATGEVVYEDLTGERL